MEYNTEDIKIPSNFDLVSKLQTKTIYSGGGVQGLQVYTAKRDDHEVTNTLTYTDLSFGKDVKRYLDTKDIEYQKPEDNLLETRMDNIFKRDKFDFSKYSSGIKSVSGHEYTVYKGK